MEETAKPTVTTRSVGIRYGLFMGVISIAYFLILNLLGVDMTQGIGRWASLIFNVAIIFLAHKYFKDNGDGFMSFGQGFGIGFWIALISSAISSVFTYVYIKFIDASFIQQVMDKTRESMEEKGNLSDEQIDQAMQMTAKFMTPESMLIFGLIGGLVILCIVSLIVTIFTQKKNPDPFTN
ncbi:MAG TPA: DUF4199 domain-containing protein [Cytophagales bacterium]|jgi:hypothetical protein|nr:DUF4199 domain-containing protein [Cytophagales bacterium]